jgi:hypothetical protein
LFGGWLVGGAACGARSDLELPLAHDAGSLPLPDARGPDAAALDATSPADATLDAPSEGASDAAGDGPEADVAEAGPDAPLTCPLDTHPSGTAYWALLAGGSVPMGASYVDQIPASMVVDSEGNLIVVGSFYGSLYLEGYMLSSAPYPGPPLAIPTSYDVLVEKFDPSGRIVFIKAFGDGYDQWGEAVAVDGSGNIYLAGQYGGTISFGSVTLDTGVPGPPSANGPYDAFLAKLDPQGNPLFAKSFGAADTTFSDGAYAHQAFVRGLTIDPAGDVVLSGSFGGSINFTGRGNGGPGTLAAQGTYDAFLAKFSGDGDYVFGQSFGTPGSNQEVIDQAIDSDGNIIVSGSFQGTIDLTAMGGPGPGLVVGNTQCGAGLPPYTAFLAKYGPDGDYLWGQAFPADGLSYGDQVRVDGTGSIVALSDFSGNSALFDAGFVDDGGTLPGLDGGRACMNALQARPFTWILSRFDRDGGRIWTRIPSTPGQGNPEALALAADDDGGSYIGFATRDPSTPGSWLGGVTKVDPLGSTAWTRAYGSGGAWPVSMASGGCGLFFAGELVNNSSMSFPGIGGGAIQFATDSNPQWDIFLARLVP